MSETLSRAYRDLNRLNLLLSSLADVYPMMTIQQAQSFLAVAMKEGSSMSEIARSIGLSPSTMSRHLLDLGVRNRKREPGLGLVLAEIDEMELRKKNFHLSPKGKQLVEKLLNIMRL